MSVTEQAITTIKSKIATGELAPGSRLPRLEDLAAELGLSRNSLREAVRALTAMNILVSRQGDGTYVASLGVSSLFEALVSAGDALPDATVLEFLRLREIVEPPAVARAAMRGTELDVRELRSICDQAGPDATAEEFVDADVAFHGRLLDMSGDPALSALVRALSPRAGQRRVLAGCSTEQGRRWVADDHDRIVRAVALGDLEAARAAASVHVSGMRRRLEDELSDAQASPLRAVPA